LNSFNFGPSICKWFETVIQYHSPMLLLFWDLI
jgi:hypothetical protein